MTAIIEQVETHPRPAVLEASARQYGVLPWRLSGNGELQILLITALTRRRWVVPKGWPASGQAPFMAAAIEAFEEAGVIGDIGPNIVAEYSCMSEREDGTALPFRVALFGFRVRGTLTHWQDAGKRKRRWFNVSEAAKLIDEPELAEFLARLDEEPEILTRQPRRRILPAS